MRIELKSITELNGMSFYIPSYQRGYRWTIQQVKDLLNDIKEFKPQEENNFYCLQPIAVKQKDEDALLEINQRNDFTNIEEVRRLLKGTYEVIDGQQRLTTIFLILKYLKHPLYSLSYETRKDSKEFLEGMVFKGGKSLLKNEEDEKREENIDFFHIKKAYEYIEKWFSEHNSDIQSFTNKLLTQTKFIWYESDEEDPIKVFTRLNIGKISLTNAELIKALFLNRSNFETKEAKDVEQIRLRQQEIAREWDNIEYTLQNDEFWLFLNNLDNNNPTRIDFIFDLICENDKLKINEKIIESHNNLKLDEIIGTDEYRTFRYFYEYFRLGNHDIVECWEIVKKYFQTFSEWYGHVKFYHYIGFLIAQGAKVTEILKKWEEENGNKDSFLEYLISEIKEKIKECKDLNKLYEIDGAEKKTTCRPLLLLHNVQTVINQGEDALKEYGKKVFYKFPFHIYKIENWDIEHIDSNTPNAEEDKNTQDAWLINIYGLVNTDTQEKIVQFVNDKSNEGYEDIKQQIITELGIDESMILEDLEKNQIMNFVLLDARTNRSYGNAIFTVKRRIIIGKDQGMVTPPPRLHERKIISEDKVKNLDGTTFIAPCTRNAFLKYYSPISTNPNYWTKDDAYGYRRDIYNTLKEFGVTLKKEEQDNVQ